MEDSFAETIKAEPQDEDFDDQLMIDDEDLVDEQNIEDPLDALDDENENQVRLEKLPRPVNELNCRQARTFLVKLLRASNGGNNPVRILQLCLLFLVKITYTFFLYYSTMEIQKVNLRFGLITIGLGRL